MPTLEFQIRVPPRLLFLGSFSAQHALIWTPTFINIEFSFYQHALIWTPTFINIEFYFSPHKCFNSEYSVPTLLYNFLTFGYDIEQRFHTFCLIICSKWSILISVLEPHLFCNTFIQPSTFNFFEKFQTTHNYLAQHI